MTVSEFFADRLGQILLQAVFAGTAAAFLLATGTASGVITLLLIAWLLIGFITQTADYLHQRAQLQELEGILDSLDQKYLFAELAPRGRDAYKRKLLDLCRRACQSMTTQVSSAQAAQREYQEYVERWVHEIKTPITAAELICTHLEGDTRRRLAYELGQVEAHVERALFYARAESPERDCVIRQANLGRIAARAIEVHRTLLIQCGVRVETAGLDCSVWTDEKWAAFILGQLLQNAARYRGEAPVITISARLLGQQVQLTVADNGIGIPAHELPRIFDRGFTGTNGRSRGGSTGMGLYLCKRLSGFLELELNVTSLEGAGTTAALTFPAKENLRKH